MSGLSRTPGKRVWVNSPPRVRIPLPPPAVALRERCKKKRAPQAAPSSLREPQDQFSATFLPPSYLYSVMAGFFSSPSFSNPMLAVTPL
jgi:hypothetical protein